jgi:hypothetical protein
MLRRAYEQFLATVGKRVHGVHSQQHNGALRYSPNVIRWLNFHWHYNTVWGKRSTTKHRHDTITKHDLGDEAEQQPAEPMLPLQVANA